MKKYLIVVILLSSLALWPFLRKGFFESHDGEWMIIRFTAFHQAFTSGQWPVRFVDRLNNNYGYPVMNFLYPLPFYFSEIFKILRFSFVDSIKITFVVTTILSVLVMFWALGQIFGKNEALAGAILYLFIPYRFVDLYVRGSIGENMAFTFIPLILGSIIKITKGQKIFMPVLAIAQASLILSHNVVAILFTSFFIVMIMINKLLIKAMILWGILMGILIATFFWLPAIYDLQYVRLSQIKISDVGDHLVNITSLIIPSWGYGPTPQGFSPLSVQFGIVPIFILSTTIVLILVGKIKDRFVKFMIVIAAGIFILMSRFSLPFWQNVPLTDVIQFPWRLLALLIFIAAYLGAYLVSIGNRKFILSIILVTASIVSTIVYTMPRIFTDKGDAFYATNEDSTTVRDEYLPLWVKDKMPMRADNKIVSDAEIKKINIKPAAYQATIYSSKNNIPVWVNTIYFPGWQVKVDGKIVPLNYQNKFGLITFSLPIGEHEVIIKYAKTPLHLFSEIISILAILLTTFYFFKFRRRT